MEIVEAYATIISSLLYETDYIGSYGKMLQRLFGRNKESQEKLLGGLEKVIALDQKKYLSETKHILWKLHVLNVVDTNVMVEWGSTPSDKYVSLELSTAIRSNIAPYLNLVIEENKSYQRGSSLLRELVKTRITEKTIETAHKEIADEAKRLGIRDRAPLILVEVLCDDNMKDQIRTYSKHFLLLCRGNKQSQKSLLRGVEKMMNLHEAVLLSVEQILEDLYNLKIVNKDVMIEWSTKCRRCYITKEVGTAIRSKAAPLIKRLQEAEQSDDEDDDYYNMKEELFFSFVKARFCDGTIETAPKRIADEAERLGISNKAPLILLQALCSSNLQYQIRYYRKVFVLVCRGNKRSQKSLLGGVEIMIARYERSLLPVTQNILQDLYSFNILDKDVMIEWGSKPSKRYVSKELDTAIRMKAAPFIMLLKEAEDSISDGDNATADNEIADEPERLDIRYKRQSAFAPFLLYLFPHLERPSDLERRMWHGRKESQLSLLGGMEKMMEWQEDLLPHIEYFLSELHRRMVDVDVMIEWGLEPSDKYVSLELSTSIHNLAKPFITSLQASQKSMNSEQSESFRELVNTSIIERTIETAHKEIAVEAERLGITDRAPLILLEARDGFSMERKVGHYRNHFLLLCRGNKESQISLLGGLEKEFEIKFQNPIPKSQEASLRRHVVSVLKLLYDLNIVEKEVLIEWHSKPSNRYVSLEISTAIHHMAECFIMQTEVEKSSSNDDGATDIVDSNEI